MRASRKFLGAWVVVVALAVSGCEAYEGALEGYDSADDKDEGVDTDYSKRKTIFGEGGLLLFNTENTGDGGGRLGVNSFLWRASLDTISFMPVNSADPFGGVIITDWHTATDSPSERFKLNIYILGRTLRADGVRVAVFRQVKSTDGSWQDAGVPNETQVKIEDAILTRARQLRNATLQQ